VGALRLLLLLLRRLLLLLLRRLLLLLLRRLLLLLRPQPLMSLMRLRSPSRRLPMRIYLKPPRARLNKVLCLYALSSFLFCVYLWRVVWCLSIDPTLMSLYNGELFVYTQSRMLSLNGRLYRPPAYFFIGRYLMDMTIVDIMLSGHRLVLNRRVFNSTLVYCITCGIRMYFLEIAAWDHEMLVLTPKVCVLQRLVRARFARRCAERQLAVAMASHTRLGMGSSLGGLGQDLVDLCARFVTWTPGERKALDYAGCIQEKRRISGLASAMLFSAVA